jgi:acetyltransferase
MGNLNDVFNPASIVFIGATDREGTVGRNILTNLLQTKDRKIFLVNPHKKSLMGLECFPDVTRVADHIDLAVIATPSQEVPGIIEECGRAGIGGAIIISAGFKEIGEEGILLEQRITAIRKKYGMRILGPNCLGFVRPNVGLNTTFVKTDPPSGNIAFISQSGALGRAILDWAVDAHVGFSMFVSLGSMIDLDFGDLIDFLGEDDDTQSILVYMEGVGNARKFMSAARAFEMRKPIIILKPGRFIESAKAARSHTGAMAGDDAIYEAAFKRVGVMRVKEIADLFDAAEVLHSQKLPQGPRLAIVTAAGGPGVMATDALIDFGGELATLSDESLQQLNQCLPSFWSKSNPIDVLGDANAARFGMATKICVSDPGVDGILVIYVPSETAPPDEVAQIVFDNAKETVKPIITAWLGAKGVRPAMEMLDRNRIPTYETPEEAVKAYVNMYKYKRNLELLYETPSELPVLETPRKDYLKGVISKALGEGRTLLNEKESKEFFTNFGIATTVPFITRSSKEAVAIAHQIGYPVVIKVVSPDISHKSDVGGVVTGIYSDEQLKKAYRNIVITVKSHAPKAVIEGIIIQKMTEHIDYELILGSKKDKDFGSVILFGMGGITAELIRDFSIGLPPLNQTLAKRLMEETKAYKLLAGWRGKPPAKLGKLEEVLVNFSHLVVDFPEIAEIDINPLAISGGEPFALDARIILDKDYSESTKQYPHLVITPYPTRFVIPSKLSDGTEILLRPIRPEDEPLEHEFLSTSSKESRRTRFFSDIRNISHEWLVMFCNIDYDRHIAMVAEVKENGERKIRGVARLIVNPDFNSGFIALLVHDSFQRRGLGQKLMETVIEIAKWKGLREIYGEVLTENRQMLGLCRKVGFATNWLPGGITKITLSLK